MISPERRCRGERRGAGREHGPASEPLRRSGRRVVRSGRIAGELAAGCRRAAWHARRERGSEDAARPRASACIEFGHPVFEPFRAARSGNFSTSRVYQYRNLSRRQRSAGPRAIRCWRAGPDRASRREWTCAPVGVGARSVGERPAGQRRSFPYSSTRRSAISRRTGIPSHGSRWDRCSIRLRQQRRRGRAATRVVLTPSGKRVPLLDEGAEVLELS